MIYLALDFKGIFIEILLIYLISDTIVYIGIIFTVKIK